MPLKASAELTCTITPRSRGRLRWTAARVPQTYPRYVTSVALRNSSGSTAANGLKIVAIASFTHASIGPSSTSTCSAAASTAWGSATSVGIASPLPPASATSRSAPARPSSPRASKATVVPSRASSIAVARPTPADAPVTTTTRPECFLAIPAAYPKSFRGIRARVADPHGWGARKHDLGDCRGLHTRHEQRPGGDAEPRDGLHPQSLRPHRPRRDHRLLRGPRPRRPLSGRGSGQANHAPSLQRPDRPRADPSRHRLRERP